jgi:hypothetical protein
MLIKMGKLYSINQKLEFFGIIFPGKDLSLVTVLVYGSKF